jgi:hypothetical protein
MINNIKSFAFFFIAILVAGSGCKKDEYNFGALKAPTGLTLTATVVGADAANPNGNGSGNVTINAASTGALTYNIDFGDGVSKVVPSGVTTYKYSNPGTATYTITVNAIGTGGSISTVSKQVTVFVAFTIPANIVTSLTNNASRVWITDKAALGHFGVDDPNRFTLDPGVWWYGASPNSREACAYDDEITFSKDANGNIFMSVNNKGTSFSIGAATAFYGFSGGDGCYAINTGGNKQLVFMDATSASTPATSTRIQFKVPGNGIINFGTGGVTYEIMSITSTQVLLRNIGADGNAWYQKLIVKP